MSLKRLASIAIAVVVLVLSVAPANAQSVSEARRKSEIARQRRAQLASELNALLASDKELTAAVAALESQVRGTEASLAAARQAVAAAERAQAAAEARVAATTKELEVLRQAVVERAVAAYVRPHQSGIAELQAKDLNEASRRRALLDQVAASDREVIDQLRQAKQDQEIEQAKAEAARETAEQRRAGVEAKLAELKKATAEKARIAKALETRIATYRAEADAVAAEEASLRRLIAEAERRAAAQRASRSAASTAADTGGRVSGAGLIWPTSGRVTSEYGYRWGRLHAGIDIGAPTGTPIRAAKAGTIIKSGWMNGYGNAVVIDHGGGFTTLYAHMSRIAAGGGGVSQGELIGYVGNTGNSTGPHLHFETRVNGNPQNPRRYLP